MGNSGPISVGQHDIYYHQLVVKGRGSPLWMPGPDMNLPTEYRREGVRIGDVAILYRGDGYNFLFNIFHPGDHPINIGRVLSISIFQRSNTQSRKVLVLDQTITLGVHLFEHGRVKIHGMYEHAIS